ADRLAAVEPHGTEERSRNPDAREDQRYRDVAGRRVGTVAPQPRRNGSSDGQIGRGDRKERHRVEHNHLRLRVHWALGMIRAANWPVETAGNCAMRSEHLCFKDGPDGLLAWAPLRVTVLATGRCAPLGGNKLCLR